MADDVSLDSIGLKHQTDKASSHHDYLSFYDAFFHPLRHQPLVVLEIGVAGGASLKTWEEYFPHAQIVGADIAPASKRFERGRVAIDLLDQSNIEELVGTAVARGPFDIVIDDGSHIWDHQLTSLRTLFPFVKHDGFYIIEDLQTNYGALAPRFRGVAGSSCMDYLKQWQDLCVAGDQLPLETLGDGFLRTYGRAVQFMAFRRHLCLIKKHVPPAARGDIEVGRPLATRAPAGAARPVRVLAHLSHQGDVYGPNGFVNLGSDSCSCQGLSLDTGLGILEYRVRSRERDWSGWTGENRFAGSRGQARPLTGVAIRLRREVAHRYALRTLARFAGGQEPVEAGDGEDCASAGGEVLCGIQVQLAALDPP
jgi:hypothetical protein